MMRKLDDYMKAADFLHGNKEARISQYKFQEIMDGVDPFDVRVFANYYGSQEARALISRRP
ncbi:MAG: hypothetical protein U0169_16540 [Polyangiaceae bacterium]